MYFSVGLQGELKRPNLLYLYLILLGFILKRTMCDSTMNGMSPGILQKCLATIPAVNSVTDAAVMGLKTCAHTVRGGDRGWVRK